VFRVSSLAALVPILAIGCNRPDEAPLHVAAAVSLSESLEQATRGYEQATGDKVTLNFAASNVLSRQIEEGAGVDVFISADHRQVERLVVRGLVAAATVVDLLSNQLVVVTPQGRPLPAPAPGGLADPAVRRIAIGDPSAVPAGVYAREWLEHVDLWTQVEGRVVPSGSVRAALSAVESGNADAAVVYRTDANARASVAVAYVVPVGDAPAITYPAAIVASSRAADRARRYLHWLRGPDASAIFTTAGFRLPPPQS
jgi:molybdate transport system substrate-binding protein